MGGPASFGQAFRTPGLGLPVASLHLIGPELRFFLQATEGEENHC